MKNRKIQIRVPYHLIFEIFDYYIKIIDLETKPYELFGKLCTDYSKKIFFFYRNLYFPHSCKKKQLEVYLSINKLIFLQIKRMGHFEVKNKTYENLKVLNITYYHGKIKLELPFIRHNFPKLNKLAILRNGNDLEGNHNNIQIYPTCLCTDGYLKLPDKYFQNDKIKNINELNLCGYQDITGRNWYPMNELRTMNLQSCPNISDNFFEQNGFPGLQYLVLDNLNITGNNWNHFDVTELVIKQCNRINEKILVKFPKLIFLELRETNETTLSFFPKSLEKFICNSNKEVSCKFLNYVNHVQYLSVAAFRLNIVSLNEFPNLEKLRIGSLNKCEGVNMFNTFKFPKLKDLRCYKFDIKNNYNIDNFTNLQTLEFGGSNLTKIFKKVKFNHLVRLEYCQRRNNKLSEYRWKIFNSLKYLKITKRIKELPMFYKYIFPKLTHLTIVSMNYLEFKNVKKFHPLNFKGVKVLEVKNQKSFVDLLLSKIEFKQLEKLKLKSTSDMFNNWKKLPKLKKLNLIDMDIFETEKFKIQYPLVKINENTTNSVSVIFAMLI